MIDTMLAVTILMVLGALALLVIFSIPWWLRVLAIAAVILLLDRLFNPVAGNEDGKAGD
ncbi:MAG: hypothetical protein AB1591_09625 [Pseudomonadota bacterium]